MESGIIVGRVGDGQDVGNPIAFAIAIDGATGEVSTAQYSAVVHSDPADHDEFGNPILLSDLVHVTLTVTDGDGDTARATSGSALTIAFEDDGPSVTTADVDPALLVMDELLADGGSVQDEGGAAQDDEAGVTLPAALSLLGTAIGAATADGSTLFNAAEFGADGASGTVAPVYALTDASGAAIADHTASGIFDTATGSEIYLFVESGIIVGRVGDGQDVGNPIAFAIAIDGATGEVSTAQYSAVVHSDPADHDEFGNPILLSDLVYVTLTVTDGDGDTARATSGSALTIAFEDDGPSVTTADVDPALLVMDESLADGGSVQDEGGAAQDDEAGVTLPAASDVAWDGDRCCDGGWLDAVQCS